MGRRALLKHGLVHSQHLVYSALQDTRGVCLALVSAFNYDKRLGLDYFAFLGDADRLYFGLCIESRRDEVSLEIRGFLYNLVLLSAL